jgi:hypothetical protein
LFWGTQFGKHCDTWMSGCVAITTVLGFVSLLGTIRCWACSSTSRALMVRLSSMISFWQSCCCWELVSTCWLSSSIWNTKTTGILEGKMTDQRNCRNVSAYCFQLFYPPPVCWTIVPVLYGLSPWWTHTDISFLVESGLGQQKVQQLLQCWVCSQVGTVKNWHPMAKEKRLCSYLVNRWPPCILISV